MESTLAIAWNELQSRVGSFLGWGRGAFYSDSAWSSQQQFEIDGIVASGLRRFYYPAPVEGMSTSYDWSFLKPLANLSLASGASTIPLPDDFGGFEGQITVLTTTSTSMPWRIEWRNDGIIRQLYSLTPTMSGPPQFAAEQPLKGTTPTQGQRFNLLIFPLADQAYTLQVHYYIAPDFLSGSYPYAYGGPMHAETILESCLAVAEDRLDDTSSTHAQCFQARLQASIAIDRRNKPQKIGYNRDNSDQQGDWVRRHGWGAAATYNGGQFSS